MTVHLHIKRVRLDWSGGADILLKDCGFIRVLSQFADEQGTGNFSERDVGHVSCTLFFWVHNVRWCCNIIGYPMNKY